MAEFVVMNDLHWSEKVLQEVQDTWTDEEVLKYSRAITIGDIVDVHPNGKCDRDPAEESKVVIIKITDMDLNTGKAYKTELYGEDGEVTKRNRFYFNLDEIAFVDGVATVLSENVTIYDKLE